MNVPFIKYDPTTGAIIESGTIPQTMVDKQLGNGFAVITGQIADSRFHKVENGIVVQKDAPDGDPENRPLTDAQKEEAIRLALAAEADPIFFKSQRGEATHQDWLDKVTEVKARYS